MALLHNITSNYDVQATGVNPTGSSSQSQNTQGSGFINTIWEQGKTQVKAKAKSKALSLAKQLLRELFGSQTAAATKNAAELGGKAATTAADQATSLANIESMVNNLSAAIGEETQLIENLVARIEGDLSKQAEEQKAQIEVKIEQIKAQQAVLADPSQPIDVKLAALELINGFSSEIQSIIEKCTEIQQLMLEAADQITTSKGAVEELTTLSQEQIELYTQEVAETVAETTEGTGEAVETGVRAGVETAKAATCATTGATLSATGVGAPVGAKLVTEGGDQGGAAGIDGTTSVTAGASFVATIGGLTDNASILDAFTKFIGAETGDLMSAIGQAEGKLPTMITSIGSMATEGALSVDLENLSTAVATDKSTLSASGAKQDAGLETPKFQFTFGI